MRMDEVAGFPVYVFHTDYPPSSELQWFENSCSSRTGYIPLRVVQHFSDGSELVVEATPIEFRDVPENMNDDLKTAPMRQDGPKADKRN